MNVSRFRCLLRAVLLSSTPIAVVAACSSRNVTEMPERAQCIDPTGSNRYASLTLAPGVDGIAFANRPTSTTGFPSSSPSPSPSPVTTSSTPESVPAETLTSLGTPCAGATDRTECERRVGELLHDASSTGWTVNLGCDGFCAASQLSDVGVITKGNDIHLATLEELQAAITPIDTREEAAAWLVLQGQQLDCGGTNNVRPEADGWTFKKTSSSCSGAEWETFVTVTRSGERVSAGTNEVSAADTGCIEGRRPSKLAPTGVGAGWLASLSHCFAEIAHMEAASIVAFEDLDRQLRAQGAPDHLLMRVASAKADEIEHAAMTSALAHRFGGRPQTPRVAPCAIDQGNEHAQDAIFQLALENAVEGCVREAFGALVAAFQASHSEDASVRATFARIAIDETNHAELSFALDEWLMARLDDHDRARVECAKADAWNDLAAQCRVEPAPDVVRIAGMPTAAQARLLLTQLHSIATERCEAA